MEQPLGNSDGLQPQELSSACNLPSVFDLTRNGEECLLKANSIDALHVVQPPSWYVSSGTSNGMALPENDPNHSSQPNDQTQPDNAFSNTTVTLSYVSRSHVFSTQNTLSQHSQLIGVPISKTFSLHPTVYDASQLAGTDGAPLCVEMDQHYLQQVSVPVGLAACASSFEFVTPAQVVENVAGLCYLPQVHEVSGIQDVESLALETLRSLQQSSPAECKIPLSLGQMQNGGVGSLWNPGSFDGSFPSGHVVDAEDQHRNGNPEVLFLISRSEEPVILQSNQGPAGLAMSLSQDFINAPEDPLSPAVASQNDIKDVFILPQTAKSPSEENAYNTRPEEVSNGEAHPAPCVEETESSSLTDVAEGFSTSINSELMGSMVDPCQTEQSEQNSDLFEVKEESSIGHKLESTALVRKELPLRTRRGMRLETIVQNIYPTSIQGIMEVALCSVEAGTEPSETTARLQEEDEEETGVADLNTPECTVSTSSSESVSKHLLDDTSPDVSLKQTKYDKNAKKRQKVSTKCQVSTGKQTERPIPELCRKRPSKQQMVNMGTQGLPTTKKVHASKKKRKKHKVGQASIFTPQEPEIKLKYANYKDERRERRDETFSPFVHVELREYPMCTVVNYPEESARLIRGKQQPPSGFASGTVPTTPCLQYSRISVEASRQATLVCCLCGGPANALDLGDLHGPYYPEGIRPTSRTPAGPAERRGENSSDSDSYHATEDSKHAALVLGCWTRKDHHKLREAVALGACSRRTIEGGLACSPMAKTPKTEAVADWFSPPVVALETREFWLHEDCCIWSAGVFLVRGKLYGLEQAIKMAKETICSCCYQTGATLGCFFKGCPNKYHYICAVQSGCVLNEENFSMKCRKHKYSLPSRAPCKRLSALSAVSISPLSIRTDPSKAYQMMTRTAGDGERRCSARYLHPAHHQFSKGRDWEGQVEGNALACLTHNISVLLSRFISAAQTRSAVRLPRSEMANDSEPTEAALCKGDTRVP
ncbi:uncharacterized protein CG5098 isoform X2 [Electrophorus electricus]|uniref:uncharacterized protein CG5098 isoform X2 n=1 Tax=Electrophorus electricus TaxID=8005 RepID=UPI0015CFF174|nr:uncharacterized protein CG5098 isoform X2 [Electrophorus electricus]